QRLSDLLIQLAQGLEETLLIGIDLAGMLRQACLEHLGGTLDDDLHALRVQPEVGIGFAEVLILVMLGTMLLMIRELIVVLVVTFMLIMMFFV
ncbi:hypothetical protein R0J93_22515, partial [Pseudoalteromonas sp. SIMBA_148]